VLGRWQQRPFFVGEGGLTLSLLEAAFAYIEGGLLGTHIENVKQEAGLFGPR